MVETLAPYYAAAQRETRARERFLPLEALRQLVDETPARPPQFAKALASSADVAVIAEYKRRSPSNKDGFRPVRDVARTAEQYRKGGAAALSILTQGADFGGRKEDLVKARQAVDLPILRKDFISDPYQLYEAKLAGADAALLIVAGLSDTKLADLHEEASDIGLDCLVEVHDEEELRRALAVGSSLVGINNRDLGTLEVDLNTTRELIEAVPDNVAVVAESGYNVRIPEHIDELRSLRVDAVLIGTALMREEDPAGTLSSWLRF